MQTRSLFLFPLAQILVGVWWTMFASNISSHKVVLIFRFLYCNITWESRLRSVVNFPRCAAPLSLDKPSRGRRPELRRTCLGCRWLACLFQFCDEIKPGRSNCLLLTFGGGVFFILWGGVEPLEPAVLSFFLRTESIYICWEEWSGPLISEFAKKLLRMAFTFAAFAYIVALIIDAFLIFFAIFHVSAISLQYLGLANAISFITFPT